jgi:ankyrin repeat protein
MARSSKTSTTSPADLAGDLIQAAILGDAGLCSRLVARGADAKAADEGGFTALMWAARYGHAAAAQALLGASDLSALDERGLNALDIAKGSGSIQVARLIESYALALAELACLGREVGVAAKKTTKAFRL